MENVNFAPKINNIKSKVFFVRVIRAHGGVKVRLYLFLPLVLDVVRGKIYYPAALPQLKNPR
jgi:hypothetical protein